MNELLVEHILRAAEQVPPGRVVSYGDLAGIVGTGPRVVGNVMATYGSNVAWWRVTNAAGDLPPHVRAEAARHWVLEGIVWKPNRLGCRIGTYRADLAAVATAYEAAVADLPAPLPPTLP